MSTATKRSYAAALEAAEAFRELFDPRLYHRWEFAGSLRRRRAEVGDIDHVIIPTIQKRPLLIGEESINELWAKLDYFVTRGHVAKDIKSDGSPRWGERYRSVIFEGFTHELWTADATNWGCICTIRTGPSAFSERLVTQLRARGFRQDKGYLWTQPSASALIPGAVLEPLKIDVPDEETFFNYCGEHFVTPEARIA